MEVTVRAIAQLVNGTIEGDADRKINRPSQIEEGGEGSITFFGNSKYEPFVYTTTASAILAPEDFKPKAALYPTLIRVPDVYVAVAILLDTFAEAGTPQNVSISEQSFIDPSAEIGVQVHIDHFCVIGAKSKIGDQSRLYPHVQIGKQVSIGRNVILHSGVKVLDGCIIGDDCIIHCNTVIGSDGFGFAPQADGTFKKIPQLGNVLIEAQVEIGSNCTIDRASMGSTIIRKGVKMDNLIQIAHNVEIGENTVIAAQTGIAGSTKIGKNCQIGGQVGFVGHIKVADGTRVQAQSGVAAAVKKENIALFGSPAIPYANYLKSYAVFKQLPALQKKIRELETLIKKLGS